MDIKELIAQIKEKVGFSDEKQVYSYRNLVFKGGGVRGIAYMGALEALDELGIITGIERVAGTSSGAIASTLVSFRLPVERLKAIFDSLDISQVAQKNTFIPKGSKILDLANPGSYKRLFEKYGWYSSEYFYRWISRVIAGQCKGNARATFSDFYRLGFRDLYIVASNISRHRAEVFSLETTPDVAVADAVRLSMSIPLYFEALRFDGKRFGVGDYYVDGGLYNNYPLDIFDEWKYVNDTRKYTDDINWESLGLFLLQDESKYEEVIESPKNLWEFVALTGRNYYDAHQMAGLEKNVMDEKRTIKINDCGVSSVNFEIRPGSDAYGELYGSGRKAVQEFFRSI
jgi:NTE family protein